MKSVSAVLIGVAFATLLTLWPAVARALPINLATLTCQRYQNELLGPSGADQKVDPINTVMWLFGFSVAKTGAHVMYGDGLSGFGFALDAECKNSPNESLQDALGAVKHSEKNSMDLSTRYCGAFAERHLATQKTDPDSADTIMMWLYGFQVQKGGGHVFDTDRLGGFEAALLTECGKHPERSLYDTLSAMKF